MFVKVKTDGTVLWAGWGKRSAPRAPRNDITTCDIFHLQQHLKRPRSRTVTYNILKYINFIVISEQI